MLLHQVGDHFGVGLGPELVALVEELLLQGQIVLDDPVVHHDHVAFAVAMGVGVFFGGTSVSGPTRVPDPVGSIHRAHAQGFFEVAQFPLGAANRKLPIVAIDGQARRVVSPVLEPFQALEDDRNGFPRSDIAHDSTHSSIIERRGRDL